ncbi:hypothetical protein ACLB2K_010534 [Fragaria x ananassa]
MASHSIFRKSLRLSLLFCRDGQPFGTRPLSSSAIPSGQDDCAVSYLVHSCRLSHEAAIEASHKVKLSSLEKPDSVLALLRQYEFSDTQISTLVRKCPKFLLADVKKTLLPKLEFLSSMGMSRLDLARILSYHPWLLRRSLENCIIPFHTLLKSVVLSDVKVVQIWKRNTTFIDKVSKNVLPNVEFVREMGMPQSCIAQMVTYHTKIVMREPEVFRELVGQVQQFGFDPWKSNFVQAMKALHYKKTWRQCEEAYRSWGWSENHILSAFRSCPLCMIKSRKKIMETMDFLVNKMGWHSHKIAKYPNVFCYSLEKRIIPRCSVVRVLLLRGLIKEEKEKLSLATVFMTSDEYFLNNFVNRYLNQVPQLLNVYQGKLEYEDV